MRKLKHPDSFHLEAAEGWLELGDWLSADGELDLITPQLRAHPSVLVVRAMIYFKAKNWIGLIEISETLTKMLPKQSQGWIHRSFALHELKKTQEAFDRLAPVADRFPKEWIVPYNLACYAAQLGNIQESEAWFKKAMAIDEHTVKRSAIDDPDLDPLWKGMEGTTWKRAE